MPTLPSTAPMMESLAVSVLRRAVQRSINVSVVIMQVKQLLELRINLQVCERPASNPLEFDPKKQPSSK